MKAVYVEWVDAVTGEGWIDKDDAIGECPIIKSIGFVVGESKTAITITHSVDDEHDNVSGHIRIPKAWIKRRKKIET